MTPGEFLAGYAERSGTTPDELLARDVVVIECSCGWAECEGWRVVSRYLLEPGEEAVVL
ncbi:hypothetical protein SEA_JAMUN_59 [Arthrobacter phage Jamun]|nr:hypothetical protein SEA_JAMUN_59 [Arthrobacter phage Jamun]